jgi:hypothetical protein
MAFELSRISAQLKQDESLICSIDGGVQFKETRNLFLQPHDACLSLTQ